MESLSRKIQIRVIADSVFGMKSQGLRFSAVLINMGLEQQIILILSVLTLGIATTSEEIALTDERGAARRLYRDWIVKSWSAILTVVELVLTHIARACPPPEPPPYQEELCGKILFQCYFLFSSIFFL
ncbi:unnamed protein product [Cuscuta europaea]|uniref:Uncharacterized protein n=1 Tax=Cuscuta europaea TaxID=41803 RepID=A0A9P0YQF0_CUSEU|nr:unnamed protein product [Cuscuta europaea]